MSEYVLEMKNICKAFPGVQALKNANLTLKPGHVHALMGENGAGKSTLMKCLFGIYKKDSGEIIYQGEEINNRDPFDALNRGIAMVHQELLPIPDRSIAENIYVGRYPVKKIGPVQVIDHNKLYKDAQALLDELNLPFDAHAKLETLTASQMQLVEKARSTDISESERVATVAGISDQDAFFHLMLKPGSDTNLAVRVAALQSIAEMDVVRFMMEKAPDSRVAAAAKERISSVYGEKCNRSAEQCADTMRSYAKRFREKR